MPVVRGLPFITLCLMKVFRHWLNLWLILNAVTHNALIIGRNETSRCEYFSFISKNQSENYKYNVLKTGDPAVYAIPDVKTYFLYQWNY
ncbi:hypothetical protein XBI1_70046 [Xenorhabdus bovienii str. Intermedium]|uniref:Uncharacterized protein n=1 Tax=Xenorhabdus bovienii str. Intermedium TaxID=1379677 RepID=A0A077QNN9_XENBV|nr:hypothetical protein XBI1_70046 [Xenorhabdus bovienii str. Intermedium]